MEAIFATLASIAIAVSTCEEWIDRVWNLDGAAAQIRTLALGVVLGFGGAMLDWGMFADPATCGNRPDIICGPIIGFAAALGANFAFTTPLLKVLLELLKIRAKSSDSGS